MAEIPPITQNGRNMLVNRKGSCFWCLQNCADLERNPENKFPEVKQELEIEDGQVIGRSVSLLRITRYLNINPDNHSLDLSSILLCDICCDEVTRLSNLCLELEVVQMKLAHQLGSFYGTLRRSESDAEAVHKFRNLVDSDEFKSFETLRDSIRRECKRNIDGALVPRVFVTRTELEEIRVPTPPSPPGPWRWTDSPVSIISEPGSPPSQDSPSTSHAQSLHDSSKPSLTSYKLDHLSQAEFKEYCDHVFQVELLLCRQHLKGGTGLECSHCSRIFSTPHTMQNHLLLDHLQIIGKKVLELQKSTGLEEIRSTNLPPSNFVCVGRRKQSHKSVRNPSEEDYLVGQLPEEDNLAGTVWVEDPLVKSVPNASKLVRCLLCDPQRELKQRDLRRHKIRLHVETFLTSHKEPSVSMSDFKLYVKHAFVQEQISTEKVYDSDGKPGWKCGHCSRVMVDEQNLQRHLFLEHREYMVYKIVELQQTVTADDIRALAEDAVAASKDPLKWKCIRCGTGCGLESSLRRHIKHVCKFGPRLPKRKFSRYKYKCGVCEKKFKSSMELKRHRASDGCGLIHRQRNQKEGLESAQTTVVAKMETEDCDAGYVIEEIVFPEESDNLIDNKFETEMIVPDDDDMLS